MVIGARIINTNEGPECYLIYSILGRLPLGVLSAKYYGVVMTALYQVLINISVLIICYFYHNFKFARYLEIYILSFIFTCIYVLLALPHYMDYAGHLLKTILISHLTLKNIYLTLPTYILI